MSCAKRLLLLDTYERDLILVVLFPFTTVLSHWHEVAKPNPISLKITPSFPLSSHSPSPVAIKPPVYSYTPALKLKPINPDYRHYWRTIQLPLPSRSHCKAPAHTDCLPPPRSKSRQRKQDSHRSEPKSARCWWCRRLRGMRLRKLHSKAPRCPRHPSLPCVCSAATCARGARR